MTDNDNNNRSRREFMGDMTALGAAALTLAGTAALSQQAQAAEAAPAAASVLVSPFDSVSTFENPKLEFVFEIDLNFTRTQNINNMPTGAGRGAVYLDSGTIKGPRLNGKAIPNSGGDYALFRPDDVLSAREMEVFRLRGNGRSSKEIADLLGVSVKTVASYDARIKEKLGLENAGVLMREAVLWQDRQRGL